MRSNDDIPYLVRVGSGLGYNTPNQILFASLLGCPAAGFWLMSKNARNFGDPKSASRFRWAGVGAMLASIALLHYLPQRLPVLLILIFLSIALRQYSVARQAAEIKKYAQEGNFKSPLPNVIFAIAFSLVILCVGSLLFAADFYVTIGSRPMGKG
ncbi:MAG: hypothetical protein ACAH80_15990 [Alphaproteobacteria bacterium]